MSTETLPEAPPSFPQEIKTIENARLEIILSNKCNWKELKGNRTTTLGGLSMRFLVNGEGNKPLLAPMNLMLEAHFYEIPKVLNKAFKARHNVPKSVKDSWVERLLSEEGGFGKIKMQCLSYDMAAVFHAFGPNEKMPPVIKNLVEEGSLQTLTANYNCSFQQSREKKKPGETTPIFGDPNIEFNPIHFPRFVETSHAEALDINGPAMRKLFANAMTSKILGSKKTPSKAFCRLLRTMTPNPEVVDVFERLLPQNAITI